jgi:hypothetical protein
MRGIIERMTEMLLRVCHMTTFLLKLMVNTNVGAKLQQNGSLMDSNVTTVSSWALIKNGRQLRGLKYI